MLLRRSGSVSTSSTIDENAKNEIICPWHKQSVSATHISLASREIADQQTGAPAENAFLDLRGNRILKARGRGGWRMRLSFCRNGKGTVLDSAAFLRRARIACACRESEEALAWQIEARAWRSRMTVELFCEKKELRPVAGEEGAWRAVGVGGEIRLWRGKRQIDAWSFANASFACEANVDLAGFSNAVKISDSTEEESLPTTERRISLPDALAGELAEVDWNRREVLVGSLGSREQLRENLTKNYYYVPAKYLDQSSLPIGFVALYQSANFFGGAGGIRYYGEVTETRRLRRGEIKFQSRWHRDDETYYLFRVKEWKRLPADVTVKDEGVYAPRLTNLFLLTHVSQSYELFCVRSAEQYRLLYSLKQMLMDASEVGSDEAKRYRLDGGLTVRLQKGSLEVLRADGKRLFENPIRLSAFLEHPKYYFTEIVEKGKL